MALDDRVLENSFGLAGEVRVSVVVLVLRSMVREALVVLPIALAGLSGLSSLLLPRETCFLLNISESRPRKSRLLPAVLMSESEPCDTVPIGLKSTISGSAWSSMDRDLVSFFNFPKMLFFFFFSLGKTSL